MTTNGRDRRILLDRAHGMTCEQAAAKYGISTARVHQIEVQTARVLGVSQRLNPVEVGLAVQRIEAMIVRNEWGVSYSTPEGFHIELQRERNNEP